MGKEPTLPGQLCFSLQELSSTALLKVKSGGDGSSLSPTPRLGTPRTECSLEGFCGPYHIGTCRDYSVSLWLIWSLRYRVSGWLLEASVEGTRPLLKDFPPLARQPRSGGESLDRASDGVQ